MVTVRRVGPSPQSHVRYRFSAFWLRSSVVSVLISLISDMSPMWGLHIKLIFVTGSWKWGLLRPLHASTWYCISSRNGALSYPVEWKIKSCLLTSFSLCFERILLCWCSGPLLFVNVCSCCLSIWKACQHHEVSRDSTSLFPFSF